MTLTRIVVLAACCSALGTSIANGPTPFAKGVSDADRHFMREACMGHMGEIKLGWLAQKNGSSDFVKSFGKRMVHDHGIALEELRLLGKKLKTPLPKAIGADQKAAWAKLSKLKGAAFDSAYKADMLQDHKMDYAAFSDASKKAKDSNVKAYATKYAFIVGQHLKMITDGKMDM